MRAKSTFLTLVISFIISVTLAGISACKNPTQDETVIESAFNALKARDWKAFSKISKTTSDFDLKSQGLSSPIKQSMSYSSLMKKEQAVGLKELFSQATLAEEGQINFSKSTYEGFKVINANADTETIAGDHIPTVIYSFKVKNTETGQVSDSLYPHIGVVKWGDFKMVISIDPGVSMVEEGFEEE